MAEACRNQGFSLFLAHFQHSKWGRCDEDEYNLVHASSYHEIYDVDDYKWELTTVFTSDGKQLIENMAVNEEDTVQTDLFDKAEPDDEEYGGWTRNDGLATKELIRHTSTTEAALCLYQERAGLSSWRRLPMKERPISRLGSIY